MQFFERIEPVCKSDKDGCNPRDEPEVLQFNVWIYVMLVTISTGKCVVVCVSVCVMNCNDNYDYD